MSKTPAQKKLVDLKARLNQKGPGFCLAKWKQVTLHLQNGLNHSCHHPFPHPIPTEQLQSHPSTLHNTEFKKQQRQKMLTGGRPSECQFCWNIEDTPAHNSDEIFSDRVTKSAEPWAQPSMEAIEKLTGTENINPSYVEVSFSSTCQFKCSYCSPLFSTKWQEEAEKHGPYPTSMRFNDLDYFKLQKQLPLTNQDDNVFVKAFWDWWPQLKNDLHVLRVTGGEPLLSSNTFKLLDELAGNPLPHLQLAINTNAGVPTNLIDRLTEKISFLLRNKCIASFHLFTSIDSIEASAEYARYGLDYGLWKQNVDRILKALPQARFSIICTTNVFSLENYHGLVELVLKLKTDHPQNRITLDTNILRFPHHQNLSILTEDLKAVFQKSLLLMKAHFSAQTFEEGGIGFYDFEINRLQRLIEYISSGGYRSEGLDLQTARRDFYHFVNEHDKRRKTRFTQVFPSLLNFYRLCEESAKN